MSSYILLILSLGIFISIVLVIKIKNYITKKMPAITALDSSNQDKCPSYIRQGLVLLGQCYQDMDGMKISITERERLHTEDPSFTYGEITFASIATSLMIAKPAPNEVFYDLGSGSGKAVFCAALLYPWKECCGIEYLPALSECSTHILDRLQQSFDAKTYFSTALHAVHFIHDNMLTADFSEADVVHISATTFTPNLWEPLMYKLERLKQGARIIVLTKRLTAVDKFELIEERFLPMSWGMNSVMVYRRI